VAIKVIRPEFAGNAEILRMFKQELVLARQVTHSNVIRIYDLGVAEGMRFITMQFVEGKDLKTILRERKKLGPKGAAAIMLQVCEGLEAAHKVKVIHRDLKPQNIMIDAEGRALVMDFGLALSTNAAGAKGALFGTPLYMSPEQARREELDTRSDIFAIGIIFYELLTGCLPFEATTVDETLERRQREDAPAPLATDPTIPKAVNDIVVRCLKRDRTQRYQSLAAINHDLRVYLGLVTPVNTRLWKRVTAVCAVLLLAAVAITVRTIQRRPVAPPKTVTMLVADFDNQTGDKVLDGTLEPLFTVAMENASFISAYNRTRAHQIAGQVKTGAAALDGEVARLVALREGVNVVLTGAIARSGSDYTVSVKALDAATGNQVAQAQVKESKEEKLAADMGRLAGPIRKALGDRTPASSKLEEGETFTAASLEAAQQYSLGQDAQARSRNDEAIEHYKKALELDPNNGRAYSGIGVSYGNLENREEAEKNLKVALSKSGQMSEREKYRTRAAYYYTIKNYEKAVDEYKALIERFPADNVGYGNLAICYSFLRNLPKAVEAGQKAVEIYPKDLRQRMNLAESYVYAGRFEDAAREADEALKLNPMYERAYVAKAIAALAGGKPDQAAAFYEEAGQKGQRYRVIGLADVALYEGRASDAVELLQKGIKDDLAAKHNDWAVFKQVALAQALVLQGQRPAAAAAAMEALKDKDETVQFLAGRTLLEAGQEAQARRVAEALSKQLYNEPLAYGKLLEGELALEKRQVRDAIKLMLDARSLVDTWIGHYDLGRAYVAAEAWPEADSEFDACINRRGEAASLYFSLVPTYSYLPPVYYYSGLAKQGVGSPAAAESFQTYLNIRAKAGPDPLLVDAKKRMGK